MSIYSHLKVYTLHEIVHQSGLAATEIYRDVFLTREAAEREANRMQMKNYRIDKELVRKK